MQQVPYSGPTNVRRHRKKLSRLDDVEPGEPGLATELLNF